jgi:cellulose synthase operon protein B
MQVIDHPALLVACALLSALILGFGIFAFMRLWIRRRAS